MTTLQTSKIGRFFARHYFSCRPMLSASDAETMLVSDLMELMDEQCKDLWNNLNLEHTQSRGHPILREEIASSYQNLETGDVLCLIPSEGIFIATHAVYQLCKRRNPDKECHAIVTFPAFQSLYEDLKGQDCPLSYWRPRYDGIKGWQFNMDDLRALIRDSTQLIVVNFPHNPTAACLNREEWNDLIELCRANDIILFSDEMYRLTNNDGNPALPSACEIYEKAISLAGLSKTYGLAGLRTGWLCTRDKILMEALACWKDYLSMCSPSPSELLSIVAFRNREKIRENILSIIKSNLDILDTFASKYREYVKWVRPEAGTAAMMHFTPKLFHRLQKKLQIAEPVGATELSKALLDKTGVVLLPSAMYDVEDDGARIGFGRKSFKPALELFDEFLAEITAA